MHRKMGNFHSVNFKSNPGDFPLRFDKARPSADPEYLIIEYKGVVST